MTEKASPPRGWKAIPWRMPICLYKLGLGWTLGKRFLLLTHTGRKSGLPRQAVLEIMRHDPQTDTYYVSSGFGEKSHWFQNVMQTPQVTLQVGNRRLSAVARRLPRPEAERELSAYAQEHPLALKELSRILGFRYDGSQASLQMLVDNIPIVAFHVSPKGE
ncbi:MAG: nitroreductase family deazaflavin-dependent oxidoreductase [Chloroflexi bacterium]|nr:nitroreductase family deazaflavin-dependent oxidoreductase [Chloroflexota bacterium]